MWSFHVCGRLAELMSSGFEDEEELWGPDVSRCVPVYMCPICVGGTFGLMI